MLKWIWNILKKDTQYNEAEGDRHLMTEAEFQQERAARSKMFDDVERRFYGEQR